jgi:hypothetical protein
MFATGKGNAVQDAEKKWGIRRLYINIFAASRSPNFCPDVIPMMH